MLMCDRLSDHRRHLHVWSSLLFYDCPTLCRIDLARSSIADSRLRCSPVEVDGLWSRFSGLFSGEWEVLTFSKYTVRWSELTSPMFTEDAVDDDRRVELKSMVAADCCCCYVSRTAVILAVISTTDRAFLQYYYCKLLARNYMYISDELVWC